MRGFYVGPCVVTTVPRVASEAWSTGYLGKLATSDTSVGAYRCGIPWHFAGLAEPGSVSGYLLRSLQSQLHGYPWVDGYIIYTTVYESLCKRNVKGM